ncbi:hypothetical protein R1flu_021268 [Riccia fluitans]|uniref:Uncharacterized protein n=1 Tax=Riccia fluitans TaxID=41844 RepID=A0ABD1ZP78_9MARC
MLQDVAEVERAERQLTIQEFRTSLKTEQLPLKSLPSTSQPLPLPALQAEKECPESGPNKPREKAPFVVRK